MPSPSPRLAPVTMRGVGHAGLDGPAGRHSPAEFEPRQVLRRRRAGARSPRRSRSCATRVVLPRSVVVETLIEPSGVASSASTKNSRCDVQVPAGSFSRSTAGAMPLRVDDVALRALARERRRPGRVERALLVGAAELGHEVAAQLLVLTSAPPGRPSRTTSWPSPLRKRTDPSGRSTESLQPSLAEVAHADRPAVAVEPALGAWTTRLSLSVRVRTYRTSPASLVCA